MVRCPCGFVMPGPMHFRGPGGCPHEREYYRRLKKATQASVMQLSARFDQIKAACRDEGREPSEEEWAELRAMIGVDKDGNEV